MAQFIEVNEDNNSGVYHITTKSNLKANALEALIDYMSADDETGQVNLTLSPAVIINCQGCDEELEFPIVVLIPEESSTKIVCTNCAPPTN